MGSQNTSSGLCSAPFPLQKIFCTWPIKLLGPVFAKLQVIIWVVTLKNQPLWNLILGRWGKRCLKLWLHLRVGKSFSLLFVKLWSNDSMLKKIWRDKKTRRKSEIKKQRTSAKIYNNKTSRLGSGCSTAEEHSPCNQEVLSSDPTLCWLFHLSFFSVVRP